MSREIRFPILNLIIFNHESYMTSITSKYFNIFTKSHFKVVQYFYQVSHRKLEIVNL